MSSPKPNAAGYFVLAAFGALALWAFTAKGEEVPKKPAPVPKTFTWVPVQKSGIIVPGLGAEWSENPNYPGKVPDFYDVDAKSWSIDHGLITIADPDALVVNREEM